LNNRQLGAKGEDFAQQFLENKGYKILARNFRFAKLGEIDVIVQKGQNICFIEVKTRSSTRYGKPNEAVNYSKQRKIKQVAQIFIKKHQLYNQNIRFDIIELIVQKSNNEISIQSANLIKNAY